MENFKQQFDFDPDEIEKNLPYFSQDDYVIEPDLYEAVKLALILNQPLLLTGKPGTGKTKLAHKLAADLHKEFNNIFLPTPLVFNTKTTSSYTDLFYSYDALSHFHAANFNTTGSTPNAAEFIQLQALGQAIILSGNQGIGKYKPLVGLSNIYLNSSKSWSSVVLIDEVDKAPRDFTNDLLNELEQLEFTIKENKSDTYRAGEGRIIVILTSNSEKNLPDAFLRRCLFYHIDFPSEKLLKEIILRRLFAMNPKIEIDPQKLQIALGSYLNYFLYLRDLNLKKQPATAELISWVYYLRKFVIQGVKWADVNFKERLVSLSVLAKHSEDLALLRDYIKRD